MDLPESLVFKMDKAFKVIEETEDGAVESPPTKRPKKDMSEKKAEKEKMKAKLAKLVDEAKALQQQIEASQ